MLFWFLATFPFWKSGEKLLVVWPNTTHVTGQGKQKAKRTAIQLLSLSVSLSVSVCLCLSLCLCLCLSLSLYLHCSVKMSAELRAKLEEFGQSHVLKYWDDLDQASKDAFEKQLSEIDFASLTNQFKAAMDSELQSATKEERRKEKKREEKRVCMSDRQMDRQTDVVVIVALLVLPPSLPPCYSCCTSSQVTWPCCANKQTAPRVNLTSS